MIFKNSRKMLLISVGNPVNFVPLAAGRRAVSSVLCTEVPPERAVVLPKAKQTARRPALRKPN